MKTIPPTIVPLQAIFPEETIPPTPLPTVTAADTGKPRIVTDADRSTDLLIAQAIHENLTQLQAAKEELVRLYKKGDFDEIGPKVTELSRVIRNNDDIGEIPGKMDYMRVSYYQYIDQMQQFTNSFSSAMKKMEGNDNNSANSYFDAGIIASDRADISEKQIQTFLQDQFPGELDSLKNVKKG